MKRQLCAIGLAAATFSVLPTAILTTTLPAAAGEVMGVADSRDECRVG